MSLPTGWTTALVAAGLLTCLGVFLLIRRSHTPATNALATFALGLAGVYVFGFLWRIDVTQLVFLFLSLAAYLVTSLGLFGLAWRVPTRLRRDSGLDRMLWLVGFLGLGYAVADFVAHGWDWSLPATFTGALRQPVAIVLEVSNAAYAFSGILLAYRAFRPETPPNGARSLAILAIGVSLFGAGTAQAWVEHARDLTAAAIVNLLLAMFLGLAWFRFGSQAKAKLGRVTAAIILGVWAGATLSEVYWPTSAYPVGRILGTLLLVYAVLHGEISGVDAKIRFTLSKSTVAAIFVGVFFAASELAQQFFGQEFQSQYLGIAAAGLLVVAIAPLQRWADRFAQRAIPGDPMAVPPAEAAYLAGLRAAARDGRITRREERHLAEMAEHLDIKPTRALALRERMEDEAPR